jgi:dipeptidase D
MSVDLPGLVETSANIGVMHLEDEELELGISIRSSVVSAKEHISRKVQLVTELLGGTAKIKGDYPAWPYARESRLRDLCIEVYENLYGSKPEVQLIHAGLECGLFTEKFPGLDMVSFGPTLRGVHAPGERLDLASLDKFVALLLDVVVNYR